MRVPLATNSYQARALPLSAQRLVNLYPELQPPDAKFRLALYGTPGLALWSTIGTGPIRGMWSMANVLYVVSGTGVYKVDSAGAGVLLGTIGGSGAVSMADSGTELAIVTPDDAGKGYIATTTTLTQIVDADYLGASSVTYIDGYFVFTRLNSAQFFNSELLAGLVYDPLDIGTAESHPDKLVGCTSLDRQLWLIGETSTEVWFNTGGQGFPFERITGGVIEKGCAARGSIVNDDDAVYWLGDDRFIYRGTGLTATKISTHAIDDAIEKYAVVNDAIAFTDRHVGHAFYILTFPTAMATWVYDPAAGLWHERETSDAGRWRVNAHADAYGLHLGGDYASGKIFEIDLNTYTDNGGAIIRTAISPPIHADGKRAKMKSFEVEMETGVGLTTGQGSDPQAMLEYSDDGGRTWSNQKFASFGKTGEYRRRVKWRRLGQFRQRCMRVTISDPVKVSIIAANADVAGSAN